MKELDDYENSPDNVEQEVSPEWDTLGFDPTDDHAMVTFSQTIRGRLVSQVTKAGTEIPSDRREQRLLLEALNGMDTTSLGRMRAKQEEENGNMAARVAETVSNLMEHFGGNPLRHQAGGGTIPQVDASALPDVTTVPGELAESDSSTLDEVRHRVEKHAPSDE